MAIGIKAFVVAALMAIVALSGNAGASNAIPHMGAVQAGHAIN